MADADPLLSGSHLRSARSGDWLSPVDIDGPVVVLVHGFTGTAACFRDLSRFLAGYRYVPAIFEYDSSEGIDRAAQNLESHLDAVNEHLGGHGFVVVGHSFGGLVARHLALFANADVRASLRGVVALGAPHDGALIDDYWISAALDIGDLDLVSPHGRWLRCAALRQLMLKDPDRLIEHMNRRDREATQALPILTVSGGSPEIHLSRKTNSVGSRLANLFLQARLTSPNDGLVPERSANLETVLGIKRPGLEHCDNYPQWRTVNHTALPRNQQVAARIVAWLRQTMPGGG
jgi:pimeloyl-ACP methyl ester carboxylesterase